VLRRHLLNIGVAVAALAALALPATAQVQVPALIRFLGEYDIPPMSLQVDNTTVGGLSGVAYDAKRDLYYVISDDRGDFGPPRFYTVKLDIGLDGIHAVRFLGATTLDSDADTPGIQPYDRNQSDTEEIVLLPDDTLIISSERDANNQPWLRRFALDGTLLGEITLPDVFVPATGRGVRPNLAFEGVTWAPDESALYAMNEEALAQDGPIATTSEGTLNRLVRFNASGDQFSAGRQAVYQTDKIFATPIPPDQAADNGVSALIWSRDVLPSTDFIAMERAFVTGVGNQVNLYGVRVDDADDISGLAAVPRPFTGRATDKRLLANIGSLGITPDNLEGLTLGPKLPDGRTALIVVSDDNFSATQIGQFLLFEI
jgi:hypothetical protein